MENCIDIVEEQVYLQFVYNAYGYYNGIVDYVIEW